jgi:DNA-binding MarR family transcriptional regulator
MTATGTTPDAGDMPPGAGAGGPGARAQTLAELGNRIFFRLYQAANMMHKTGTRALESKGVTTQQWAVIGALSRPQAREGMSVGELARFLMVSRQNLTVVVARLEKQGYLTRVRDAADGRSRRLWLTPDGEALWQGIVPLIFDYYEQALDEFGIGDRARFLVQLEKLIANMNRL